MGGASPYRARFIALPPCGQNGNNSEGVPCDNGEKYFGFTNVANTCYVNSVLQALYFCAPFRRSAIQHLAEEREEDSSADSLLTSMAELFSQIEGQKRTVGCLTPRRFLAKLRKANDLFCTSEHQDAHEFMQFLLNDIAEHVKKRLVKQREREKERARLQNGQSGAAASSGARQPALASSAEPEEEPRTWVHDIFQGYLVNQMKCLCCENVTVRRETFLDLSVDIERHTSVAACLRAFESTELLRAGNKFFCDTCACLQEAEKRLRVYQLPSVLTLHLKRFKYIERLGRCCRLPYRVVFPLQLRVVEHRPRSSGGAGASAGGGAAAAPGSGAQASPAGAASPTSPARSSGAEPSSVDGGTLPVETDEGAQPPSRLFELRSVVVHIGRDSSRGHYVTIVRQGDRCVLIDDDVVRVVEPEVLRSFYGTAGTPAGGGHGSGGNQDRSDRQHGHHGPNGGWSGGGEGGGGGDRFPSHSSSVPLYERSPEGTCCGYLLFYEAVDGVADQDATVVDVGAAADWISEDRNFSDSESGGESAEDRTYPNTCDDSELTQAFEQRCIPRAQAARQRNPASPSSGATPTASLPEPWGRERAAAQGPGFTPAASGHGMRPLGAVVPSAGSGETEAVSPSRVDVVTVPSASANPEGATGAETERG